MKRIASCSDAQQLAELLLIKEFSLQLGKNLGKADIPIGSANVAVDGFYKDDRLVVLVEAWAHIGKAKSAQRNKILGDMLKLALVTSVVRRANPDLRVEAYLVFADQLAARTVIGKGWASVAAKEFGIIAEVIVLSEEVIRTIQEAQRRQDIRVPDECESDVD